LKMSLSNRVYSVVMLTLSVVAIFYMLFMLIIVPILPLDEDNILCSFSPTPIVLVAGISGLIFCGSLSVFTIFVMCKGNWKQLCGNKKHKIY
jgi:Zn-dependent protease